MNQKQADNNPTTIGYYGLAIRKALEANGYDTAGIFAAAGIDHVPSNDPLERLGTAEVAALFRECVKLTGIPAVGLTVARFMHPSALHALGYSLLASSTLRDCCERVLNYFRLASEMAMSPSALQQKLAERNSSFQDLLNQVRQTLALAYMEQARVSITEMSFLLGFADTSSFTRAFRRLTGKSPRDYRRNLGMEH
jgi:AraC-like DNA-binding protein